MSVRVNFEIGHEASIRNKLTVDGFTHDWEVFVKGCNNTDIHHFIEKVVFHLHETFPNPKRVLKEPPYKVKESGYAGFNLPIDIYLRNTEEPKKFRFNYDLSLQPNGPAIYKVQKEKIVINNPTEEFRNKLLKGGGVIMNSNNDTSRDSSTSDKLGSSKTKSGSSSDLQKRHKSKEHKQEDSFTNLFGTPITKTTKVSPDGKVLSKTSPSPNAAKVEKTSNPKKSKSKHSPKEKDREKEKKEKPPEKKHKEEKKAKERVKEKERKEKNIKKERSPKQPSPSPSRSPKRPPSPKRAPSPKRPPSPPPVKPKIEEKKPDEIPKDKPAKLELKKSKHEQKEKKEHKVHREKEPTVRVTEVKETKPPPKEPRTVKEPPSYKPKEKPIKPPEEPVQREIEKVEKIEKLDKPKPEKPEVEKPKHKHKKKENKEKREKKEEKIKEKKGEKKIEKAATETFFDKTYRDEQRDSPKELEKNVAKTIEPPTERSAPKEKTKVVAPKQETIDESSNSSLISNDDSNIEVTPKVEKVEKKKEKSKSESNSDKKRKRKHEANIKEETPIKIEEPPSKVIREDVDYNQKVVENKKDHLEEELAEDYMSILKELQHKIMTLQDNAELQRVVQLIAETGHYEITAKTFDFDLCTLDRDTVRRLQEFFAVT